MRNHSGRRHSFSAHTVMFSRTVMWANKPSRLRSSVTIAIPACMACAGCLNRPVCPQSGFHPEAAITGTKQALQQFGTPCTHQTRDAQHFASMQFQIDILQSPAARMPGPGQRQMSCFQYDGGAAFGRVFSFAAQYPAPPSECAISRGVACLRSTSAQIGHRAAL